MGATENRDGVNIFKKPLFFSELKLTPPKGIAMCFIRFQPILTLGDRSGDKLGTLTVPQTNIQGADYSDQSLVLQ